MRRRPPQRAGAGPPSWSVTVHGSRGALRHGYQHAARLGAWTLERIGRRRFCVSAVVTDRHAYWSRQMPLDLVLELDLGGASYRWPAVAPPTADGLTTWEFFSPPIKE